MKMMNHYLLCEDEQPVATNVTGFSIKDSEKRFKTVTVICSNEEDIPVGSSVVISVNSGEKEEQGLVIKRTDVIYMIENVE